MMTRYHYQPLPLPFLTEERFDQWLTQQPDLNIAGKPGDGCLCPIATFINDMGEYSYVFVRQSGVRYEHLNEDGSGYEFGQCKLTAKLARFIGLFDRTFDEEATVNATLKLWRQVYG